MADISVERKPAGQYTWLWMLLALVLVGAFIAWLAVTSEPTTVAVQEDGAGDVSGTATAVQLADFGRDPRQYLGQEVRVEGIQVASRMGAQAFWMQLPNEVPFLVRLAPGLVERGEVVQSGETVGVTGVVYPMSDSVLTAWVQNGVIQPDQRIEAEFAQSFLEADRLTRGAAPAR